MPNQLDIICFLKSLLFLKPIVLDIVMGKKMPLVPVFGGFSSKLLMNFGRQISIPVARNSYSLLQRYSGNISTIAKMWKPFFLPIRQRRFIFKQTNWKLSFSLAIKLVNLCFIACKDFIKTFGVLIKFCQQFLAPWHFCLLLLLGQHIRYPSAT